MTTSFLKDPRLLEFSFAGHGNNTRPSEAYKYRGQTGDTTIVISAFRVVPDAAPRMTPAIRILGMHK